MSFKSTFRIPAFAALCVNLNLVRRSGLVASVLALLAGPTWAGDAPFTEHIISTNADQVQDVFAADVDGDGDIDVLSASRADDKIAWYENDGGSPPTFTEHVITTGEDLARVVFAADINNDGDIDVVTAARGGNRIVWWENDGGSPPTFTEHVISASADGPLGLVAADLDDDGDLDVLYSEFDDDEIVWAESDGGSPPTWDVHIISANANGAGAVAAADVNGDGLIDVLSGSVFDLKLAWYESDGGSPPVFTERIISTAHDWRDIAVADLDDDGDADVLSTAGVDDLVVWFENDGESPPVFTEHVISVGLDFPAPIAVADIDNDCDLDVVVGADASDNLVLWYESDGGSPPMFTEHVIAMGVEGPTAVRAIDLDADGDTDVLSSSTLDSTIAWYENGSAVALDIKPGSCPNSFNRSSNGVLPVALVGTRDFDVVEVDLSSILLVRTDGLGGSIAPHEGPPGPHSVFEDVATPFEGDEQCDCDELEGDGILDLSMKFKTSDLVDALELGDLKAGELVSLTLTGNLLDGTPFEAADCIRLVPPGAPPGLLAMGSNVPGVFIEVTPLDETLDGDGFADFKRTYSLGTIVTLTAPQTHLGWVFVGWDYDRSGISGLTVTHQGGLDDRTIQIIVLDAQFSLKAIYQPGINLP